MRVLAAIVVPPHMSVSGGARAAEELTCALAASCDMTLASMLPESLAPDLAEREGVNRVPVRTTLPPGLGFDAVPRRYKTLLYRSDIDRIVRSGDYDLVHLHNPLPALEMRRIARACKALRIPYIVSTHGSNEVVDGARIYGFDRVQRTVWRHLVVDPVSRVVAGASKIFALSPHDLDLLRELGHHGDNVAIVSNGVAAPAAGDPAKDERLLRQLSIAPRMPGGPETFLFLANHTPNKGLSVLFDAFRRLRRPYQLVIGGEKRPGVPYDEYVGATGPQQRIVVTGRLSDEEAAACFRRADAFVFPTLADTFPLVVLEAMAHGLPVIASRVGGIPHQLRDGCGILVEPGSPARLAEALLSFLDDPAGAVRLGAAARRRSAEFTWARAAETALENYRDVLAERAAALQTFPASAALAGSAPLRLP